MSYKYFLFLSENTPCLPMHQLKGIRFRTSIFNRKDNLKVVWPNNRFITYANLNRRPQVKICLAI